MKKYLAFGTAFIGLLLYCAFSQGGFLVGMRTLGEIVNVFGRAFVSILKVAFSIPELAQEITKRVFTTVLVWGFYGVSLHGNEKTIIWSIMGAIASAVVTVLAWVGMF